MGLALWSNCVILMCAVNENFIMFLNVGLWLMNVSQILTAYCEINLWHFLYQDNTSKESKICIIHKKWGELREFVPSKFVSEIGTKTLQKPIL